MNHPTVPNDCMTPLDQLLMNYAAGRLGDPEQLLVNAARALNPDVRSRVAQFEAMGAQLMCDQSPAEVNADCLSLIMAKIDARPAPAAPCADKTKPCGPAPELNLPEIVHALLAAVCAQQQQWAPITKGVMRMELRLQPQPRTIVKKRLRLMKLAPRQSTPRHAHLGSEITLVLHGAFTDELGTFKRGDLIILTDPRYAHQPTAGEEGCVCLMLNEARLRFIDPIARVMNTFWRF